MDLQEFKSLYSNYKYLDYLSRNFSIRNWVGYFVAGIIEDAEPYNQPYKTEDGKMWSVITIEDQRLIKALSYPSLLIPEGKPFHFVIRGIDDFSYAKDLSSVKECHNLWKLLFEKSPLTLDILLELDFYFNN